MINLMFVNSINYQTNQIIFIWNFLSSLMFIMLSYSVLMMESISIDLIIIVIYSNLSPYPSLLVTIKSDYMIIQTISMKINPKTQKVI
jgi:hypothetical protein